MDHWKSTPDYWNGRYENQTAGWERGGVHPALSQWLARGDLNPCAIAIPGCGRGHEAEALVKAGFEVTAIDFADWALEGIRERLLGLQMSASIVQADVLRYRPEVPFDAVYEQTCLCAIEPSARQQYQQALFDWLRPGGLLCALFMQSINESGEPPFHCALEQMRVLFSDDRWEWPSQTFERFEHPSGVGHELAVILKRKGSTSAR